jgi:predicted house-cleaning noncanonical NTP pyrophosphatase (MazG superfamily)
VTQDKLTRDGEPEVIWARGRVPVLRVEDAKEYRKLLRSLLAHEARGVAAAGHDELADMLNVVGAIAEDLENHAGAARRNLGGQGSRARRVRRLHRLDGEPGAAGAWAACTGGLTAMLCEAHAHYGASAPAAPTTNVDPAYLEVRKQMLQQEVDERPIGAGHQRST